MTIYTNHDRQLITTSQELGRGGEGAVYGVVGRADLVAKIYHPAQRSPARQAKVTAMVNRPPQDRCRAFVPPHIALAWPTDLLFEQGNFAGFLMPRIERSPNIFALFNPKLRQQRYPQASRRFLYHTAQNLATVIAALHASGCVMGDVNQKNILVKPNALVTLVDTDSFQIQDESGHKHRCPVGVPDYTPPELQDKPLNTLDRQPFHDCFGLSVLIFQLLMEGYHPFTGRPLSPALAELDQLSLHCMEQGLFPYGANDQVQPPPDAPPFTWLTPELRRLFLQSFLVGYLQPAQRPTAATWAQALGRAELRLVQCRRQPAHWYGNHLAHCPECGQVKHLAMLSHALVGISKAPLAVSSPVRKPQSLVTPGCVLGLLKVGGGFYLIVFLFLALMTQSWLFPAVVLAFLLLNPPTRRKTWQVSKTVFWWLAPYAQWCGRAALAFWRRRSLQFKAIALVSLLALTIMLVSNFGGSAPVEVRQGPAQSPLVASPLASPLATPTEMTTPSLP